MSVVLIGKKAGMTHVFNDKAERICVTVIQAGPCYVTQIKEDGKDRAAGIQMGYDSKKERNTTKPLLGHFKKAGTGPFRVVKEFRVASKDVANYQLGQALTVDVFKDCKKVDVIGTSKGRGFAGVMKRHGFSGFPASHGTHEYFRHAGGISAGTTPGRVPKGKKMAGHMGNRRVTVQSLEVVEVIPEDNLILVKGAVPGPDTGYLVVRKSIKS